MIPYQWTSAGIAITIAVAIVWLVRHNHVHARNAIWWIFLGVMIAFVGIAPGAVDSIAAMLGIHYPPTLVILVGMAILLLKLLKTDIERSKEQQQMRIVAQKIAVLEAELQSKSLDDESVEALDDESIDRP